MSIITRKDNLNEWEDSCIMKLLTHLSPYLDRALLLHQCLNSYLFLTFVAAEVIIFGHILPHFIRPHLLSCVHPVIKHNFFLCSGEQISNKSGSY